MRRFPNAGEWVLIAMFVLLMAVAVGTVVMILVAKEAPEVLDRTPTPTVRVIVLPTLTTVPTMTVTRVPPSMTPPPMLVLPESPEPPTPTMTPVPMLILPDDTPTPIRKPVQRGHYGLTTHAHT